MADVIAIDLRGVENRDLKSFFFLIAPWNPQAKILMGTRALGKGPMIDVFIPCEFYAAWGHR